MPTVDVNGERLEYIQQGEWIEDSTTGMLFPPFWRKAEVVYLQNHFDVDELKNSVDKASML